MQNKSTIRKFIRHPSDIPVKVISVGSPQELEDDSYGTLQNVSLGGLAFLSKRALSMGQFVNINFPVIDNTQCFSGKVVWVNQLAQAFDTGIQFENTHELNSLRMVEQACHIEHYRNQIKQHEGRASRTGDAAREWIKRYAGEFPGIEK